jgi:hypothetical protein
VKESQVKDEPREEPTQEEDERPWWVKELVLQNAARHPDNPADVSGDASLG